MDRFALEPFVSSRYDEIETVVTSSARPQGLIQFIGGLSFFCGRETRGSYVRFNITCFLFNKTEAT